MKARSYLPDPIKKRCERCALIFEIPNVREGRARELALQFFPCTHCEYVRDINRPLYNRTGRCLGCKMPFAFVIHHGGGMCKRCGMNELRHKTPPA